jgi:hypothetical protein
VADATGPTFGPTQLSPGSLATRGRTNATHSGGPRRRTFGVGSPTPPGRAA